MSEDKVVTLGGFEEGSKQRRKVYDTDGICPTLQAAMGCGGGNNPFVLEMKLLGNIYGCTGGNYAGNVYDSNGLAPTLMTMQGGNRQPMVLEVKEVNENEIDNPLKGISRNGWHFEQNVYSEKSKLIRTIKAGGGSGNIPKVISEKKVEEMNEQKLDPKWIFEVDGEKYYIRIRKLTPKECFRLMGFNDEEYEKAAYKKEIINIGDILCNAKLKGVIEKRSQSDMEIYALNIINALSVMGITLTNGMKFLKMPENEKNQNVNIVIEKLGKPAHSECVINTIKCLENTEMLCTLMNEIDQNHTAIIGLGKGGSTNTGKYMKITSEGNLNLMRLFIILMVLELITELKICTFTLQKLHIQGNTPICVNYEKCMVKMQLSGLKMENISINNSSTQLYKQIGNSIVVDVLEAIFGELFKDEQG